MKVLLLYSGGLDSTTALYLLKEWGHEVHCLGIHYGQKHSGELDAARMICRYKGVSYQEVLCDLPPGRSRLTGGRKYSGNASEYFVPGRNTVFFAIALNVALSIGADAVAVGCNKDDFGGFPDCRREYLDAMEVLYKASLPDDAKVPEILFPFLDHSKAEVLEMAEGLSVPIHWTVSCYNYDDESAPCGSCPACKLRAGGTE